VINGKCIKGDEDKVVCNEDGSLIGQGRNRTLFVPSVWCLRQSLFIDNFTHVTAKFGKSHGIVSYHQTMKEKQTCMLKVMEPVVIHNCCLWVGCYLE